ncbi:hypothetical protein [Methylobacterium haplocladii]|uniref:Uncharacterized protein n=1 Tax=Methylobacterium haplocladii TaxID=1176176 RepID=A0A512ISG7_9HYPH|nr:hypothetical protein [Methylobacterium haplocladii]GEP00633.1 hypothetical protein MHA02_30200 [Methylobacterium haplocladii]GLS57781.1 hypothetical protein GCM10007887_04370 [Methylobacterium haplocladii]
MAVRLDLPPDKTLATRVIETEAEHNTRKLERGLMGLIFGLATEKPGNIAGFALIAFCLMFAGVLIWGTDSSSLSKKDVLSLIGGFITLTLGFVFGRTSSS